MPSIIQVSACLYNYLNNEPDRPPTRDRRATPDWIALNGEPGFIPKFAAQARPLVVVILDRFDQLALRGIEQSNLHTR
ncbi:MAG: hypothetical protein JSS44_02945 [Proteobacteria bacterium]|nr:hypothetical protein [Pseudomonadota bacterium]